jgi:hypothetical protein
MVIALYIAAALALISALTHSYLGDRYLTKRLFKIGDLPPLLGSSQFAAITLRVAWHLTSIAWLGFAALLVLLALGRTTPQAEGLVVGITFAVHGVVVLVASRGKHFSWIFFLAIAALTVYAAQA